MVAHLDAAACTSFQHLLFHDIFSPMREIQSLALDKEAQD